MVPRKERKVTENSFESLIDRLGRKALECRSLIRELHGNTKDAQRVLKNLEGATEEAVAATAQIIGLSKRQIAERLAAMEVEELLTSQVNDASDKLISILNESMASIETKIARKIEREVELVLDVVRERRGL